MKILLTIIGTITTTLAAVNLYPRESCTMEDKMCISCKKEYSRPDMNVIIDNGYVVPYIFCSKSCVIFHYWKYRGYHWNSMASYRYIKVKGVPTCYYDSSKFTTVCPKLEEPIPHLNKNVK